MKLKYSFLAVIFILLLVGCSDRNENADIPQSHGASVISDTTVSEADTTDDVMLNEAVSVEPRDEDFVRVRDYISDVYTELPYSSAENFTKQKIYDFNEPWLRYGTVKKLMLVQNELKLSGMSLKIWDGFRPTSAQQKLWDACPDPTYVSDPKNGFTSHCRGNTVDITLVYEDGTEVIMPTGFDDFSELADRDYSDCTETAADNARMLEDIMAKYGFKAYFGEWWHYSDTQSYPVEETFLPIAESWYYADCNEFISLRAVPEVSGEVIVRIPAGDSFQIAATYGDYAFAEYKGLRGYVLCSYIQPIGQ